MPPRRGRTRNTSVFCSQLTRTSASSNVSPEVASWTAHGTTWQPAARSTFVKSRLSSEPSSRSWVTGEVSQQPLPGARHATTACPSSCPYPRGNAPRPRPVWDRRAMRLAWVEEGGGAICAELLATLPNWFGMAEANEGYRRAADRSPTLVAEDGGRAVGFLTVVHHSAHAAELHVMAVRPELHRNGIGRMLVAAAEDRLRSEGVEYLQVKTLSAAA